MVESPEPMKPMIDLIIREIETAFDETYRFAWNVTRSLHEPLELEEPDIWHTDPQPARFLPSIQLREVTKLCLNNPEEYALFRQDFEGNDLAGEDLQSWFEQRGFESCYDFRHRTVTNVLPPAIEHEPAIDRPPSTQQSEQQHASSVGKWPWGSHDTALLRQLEAAAERFWVLYDPDDPSTAPTNEQVTNWLVEREVAVRVAEVIAQMLRADDLPLGRRKK